jgi:glycosyltransferase involved in cell wall biosynthesis
MSELSGIDIVWIWRTVCSSHLVKLIESARCHGARIIFDVDDLMFRPELATIAMIDGIRSQGFSEQMVQKGFSSIRKVLSLADHCTAPTSSLAQQLRQRDKPATVIPNGFDRRTVEKAGQARMARRRLADDGLVRIGYASGSRTHQRDFAVAARPVADVLMTHKHVRLVLFENTIEVGEFAELSSFEDQIEWRKLVPVDELPLEYARFDINLAPLEVGNPFCEAKSELKFFEAALVGVVTIASPTRPFAESIRNGETGFLARTESEWRDYLEKLIVDAELRNRIGQNAYADVLWRFGPERRSMLATRLINTLVSPPSVAAELARNSLAEATTPIESHISIPEFDLLYESKRREVSRVSVVIPLYNYAHYVEQALESVKWQTMPGIDIIVCDDCSTDGSLAVARRWLENNSTRFNKVALVRNKRNSKLSCTRNAAISFANTEFVLPLDADNELLPSCVERCVAMMDETGAAVAYPTIERFGNGSGLIAEFEWDAARLQVGNYIDAMAMFRKACWVAVGGYTPMEFGWEDYDFWCKFVEKGFWGIRVPEVTARYRVHGTSMLQTSTNVPANLARIIAAITARHPWLDPNLRQSLQVD